MTANAARWWMQMAALVGLSTSLWAQQDSGWRAAGLHWLRTVEVPGARDQAVSVLWPHVRCTDAAAQRALATALGALRRRVADAVLPPGCSTTSEVGDEFSVFTVVMPAISADTAAAWLTAMTAPVDVAADADVLARTLAQAALAADDARWLFPGEILTGRARRALAGGTVGGTAVLGSPRFLQQLDPALFAGALASSPPRPLRVVMLGAASGVDEVEAALARLPVDPEACLLSMAQGPAATEASAVEGDDPVDGTITPHSRVDATYMAAAVRAGAPTADTLSVAVAIEVLRSRAQARLRSYRGDELLARAPFVGYRYLFGDPVVVFCRRGATGSEAERPRRELEALLADAVAEPPSAREVDAALRLLGAEWSPPPWSEAQLLTLRELPQSLGPRAQSLCLLGHWRIPDAAVRGLRGFDASAVSVSLRDLLAAPPWWGGLRPTTTKPAGW